MTESSPVRISSLMHPLNRKKLDAHLNSVVAGNSSLSLLFKNTKFGGTPCIELSSGGRCQNKIGIEQFNLLNASFYLRSGTRFGRKMVYHTSSFAVYFDSILEYSDTYFTRRCCALTKIESDYYPIEQSYARELAITLLTSHRKPINELDLPLVHNGCNLMPMVKSYISHQFNSLKYGFYPHVENKFDLAGKPIIGDLLNESIVKMGFTLSPYRAEFNCIYIASEQYSIDALSTNIAVDKPALSTNPTKEDKRARPSQINNLSGNQGKGGQNRSDQYEEVRQYLINRWTQLEVMSATDKLTMITNELWDQESSGISVNMFNLDGEKIWRERGKLRIYLSSKAREFKLKSS